ncbi:LysR family transcriptional regulator [Novosphingobium sediminicola]|uniref:DNA-binding transcriptional LysR family regulator n=1 Tax=Novosphingobium sediminicola TaxID=563162 RepID=A0A7W6CFH4_9SPHN|nr:LysR family transcriptional regulator [Novosphingobium sediminicola]MBB3955593.1 DNA-binding transcriptional LysR family regulator [Novosphingobium sediminicola]
MDMFAAVRAFVAVVEEGGFAPAARRAGQAASSYTRHVDALEAELGVVLLNRSTRRLSLTPAGEAYYPQAVVILAGLEEAHRSIRERDGPPRGLLRVSLPTSFARMHIVPFLPRFMAEHPGVELDLLMSDEVINLVERRVDVAIRLGALDSSSLIARRLAPHRRIVCASPAYLAQRGTPATPADLADHACLTFAFTDGERRWRLTKGERVEQIRVKGPLRANQAEALKEAALAGFGVVMLPTWLAGEEIAQGSLRPLLNGWQADIGRAGAAPSGESGIHALYLPDRRGSPKVRAFVDFLAERFGNPPYWDRAL